MKTSMPIDEINRKKTFIYKYMMKSKNALKEFIFRILPNNDPIDDEPTVTFTTGNKRINDENLTDSVIIKKRKLSPAIARGIIDVESIQPSTRKGYLNVMPRYRRSEFNNSLKPKTNNVQVNSEVIEINDNDDVDRSSNNRVIELDLTDERSGECNKKASRHTTVPSSSTNDVEIVDEYSLDQGEGSSGLQNSKALAYTSRYPSVRIQRNKSENRTLKEINNRHPITNSYLDVSRKGTSTSSSSSQSTTNSFRDISSSLSLTKMQKARDRETFLKLLKQCAQSPNGSRKSLSDASNVSLSDTRQSERITSSPANCSYYTRFPNSSEEKKDILVPSPPKFRYTSKPVETSAIDKTVIDLTSEDDDESQRQEIVSNVISSDVIRNLKTSFVGKDKDIVEEDYISNILKKYESKLRLHHTQANKIHQRLRDDRESFHKTLSEILEKRLVIKEHEKEEEVVEPKPSFEIAPITKAMTAAINQMVASKKVPLAQIKDTAVRLQDIRTLENCAWLNDEVINAYMNLIKMRAEAKPDKYPKVHCFNTFLYEQLQKRGYNSVRRWTKKIDVFDYTMLIVPIHLGNHWCLIQMKIKEKCIRYFDSMGSPNNHCLKVMLQYLVDEYKDKKNSELDTKEWQLINLPSDEIPQQRNGYDCGVFACTFAEHLTRQAPFNFSQDHMPYFRVKMMYEILTGELLL